MIEKNKKTININNKHADLPLLIRSFWLKNRFMTRLIFLLFEWLQQNFNQSYVKKINPVVIRLFYQNAHILYEIQLD